MLSRVRAVWLSVLIGICSPNYLFPQNGVVKDTPQVTAAGVTFTAPGGWSVAGNPSAISLLAPEGDTHVVVLDEKAADAAAATTQAWAAYKPGFARPVRTTEDIPDRDGWTGGKQIIYETFPNERAVMAAIARRAGDNWSVVLLDGSEPTFEKRGSQIGLVVGSLRPKDYQRESFAGRKPLPLTIERIETLRSFVETSMKKLDVPGAGFALIDQRKVVYEGGIGFRAERPSNLRAVQCRRLRRCDRCCHCRAGSCRALQKGRDKTANRPRSKEELCHEHDCGLRRSGNKAMPGKQAIRICQCAEVSCLCGNLIHPIPGAWCPLCGTKVVEVRPERRTEWRSIH